MTAGRPRKPDYIKKAQGTFEASRSAGNIILPTGEVINEVPLDLSDRQKQLFMMLCELCVEANILMQRFVPDLVAGCVIWDKWIDAVEQMNRDGIIQEASSGWLQKSAALSAFTELTKLKVEFESRYGINLTGYEKMGIKPKKHNPDFD